MHCREWQQRVANCGGGTPISMNLRTLNRVEVVDKHQWLTVVYALLTVEAGEHYDGLATCDRARRQRSTMDTVAESSSLVLEN